VRLTYSHQQNVLAMKKISLTPAAPQKLKAETGVKRCLRAALQPGARHKA
jgi:hypothetical protein